jgi:hypothetical protein
MNTVIVPLNFRENKEKGPWIQSERSRSRHPLFWFSRKGVFFSVVPLLSAIRPGHIAYSLFAYAPEGQQNKAQVHTAYRVLRAFTPILR